MRFSHPMTEHALRPVIAAGARLLDRRALDRAIRAEHAAVARPRSKHRVTARAFVEVDARIGWHTFDGRARALRAGQNRLEDGRGWHASSSRCSFNGSALVASHASGRGIASRSERRRRETSAAALGWTNGGNGNHHHSGNSRCCGKPSVISYHGALELTNSCDNGLTPGSSSNDPMARP
jgi:hypothetical protein